MGQKSYEKILNFGAYRPDYMDGLIIALTGSIYILTSDYMDDYTNWKY